MKMCSSSLLTMNLMILLIMTCWLTNPVLTQQAKLQYTIDQKSDCFSSGYLLIPRDQVTKLTGPSKDVSTATQTLRCSLEFGVETKGDTLKVTLTTGSYIEQCDIELTISDKNSNKKIQRGCLSGIASNVPALEIVDGQVIILLTRKVFDNRGYWIEISVTAVRTRKLNTEALGGGGSTASADAGMIAGIVAGVIVLIIILIIIYVCCCKRGKTCCTDKANNDKGVIVKNTQVTTVSHGYENNMAKVGYDDSFHKSPESGRKLLSSSFSNESETGKPKSALERFGNTPNYRGGQLNVERNQSQYNAGRAAKEKYEERDYGRMQINQNDRNNMKSNHAEVQKSVRDVNANTTQKSATQSEASAPQKSSVMAALHNNSKFRKSFHENEADAEERVRRVSDRSSVTNSSIDSENFPVAPKVQTVTKNKSPPRSPSSQKQVAKNTSNSRDRLSSGSSSEESEDRNTKTKHSLRPTRDKSNKSSRKHYSDDDEVDEKRKKSRESEKKLRNRYNDELSDEDSDESRGRERTKKDNKKSGTRNKDDVKASLDDREKRITKDKGPGSVDDSDDRSQYEGRFKKSASGRKPKGKGQRIGRSRSTGNALEEMDSNYQSTHYKSPSSIKSSTIADDDDELDSNYEYFKRSGSKTSLYASRSSLYGRRRKNSMGETVSMSSYMHDDVDSRMGDFDRQHLSHKEKERLFKSTGDLDLASAAAFVFRECATQTGHSKEVYVYGRRTIVRNKPGKLVSRGTQTGSTRERRDSAGSVQSGRSSKSNRLKSRSKSQESLRKHKSSRSRDLNDSDNASERSRHRRHGRKNSDDDNGSERSHSRRRTKSSDRDLFENDDKLSRHRSESSLGDNGRRGKRSKSRDSESSRSKHKSKSGNKKSASTASNDFSNSDDDRETVISSVAPSSIQQVGQQIPQYIPIGYPMAYPQPGLGYMPTAPGGPPLMIHTTAVPQSQQKPSIAPKPNTTKWDQLVNLTEGMKKRRHQMGESLDTESVMSSAWSQPMPHGGYSHTHYSQVSYNGGVQRMHDSGSTSSYLESVDITKLPKEHVIGYNRRYAPTDSNV